MKTTIKILAALAVMMGFSINAMAQTQSAEITAKATVFDQISVVNKQDLNFGQVIVNTTKTVDINGSVTGNGSGNANSIVGVNAGQFNVFAGAGSDVQLEFTQLPSTLTGPGSKTLDIVYDKDNNDAAKLLAAYGTNADASEATRFDPNSSTQVSNGAFPTNQLDSKNGIWVFIGGTVKPAADQTPGEYTGKITLTATYN